MCKSKMAVNAAEPNSITSRNSRTSRTRSRDSNPTHSTATAVTTTTTTDYADYSSGSSYILNSSTATESIISSRTSLSSLRQSLPDNPHIYDFSEIRSATNNFLAKPHSSSSSPSWRCSLRGRDALIFQRKFRNSIQTDSLKDKLSIVCRSHHRSIVKLLGASISGDHVYMVYEFMQGGDLSNCLRNPRNPEFTVLSTWMSRMQIASDLADGLDYIHNNTGQTINLIHKYVSSSSVIVTEPSFNAKICHFATAELCGEVSNNGELQFEGVMGYMSPEFQSSGMATQRSDVYAFGVVLLEILSGEEPLKYKLDKKTGDYIKLSVIESATDAVESGGAAEELNGRLRRWIDRRLKDSFPVEVAEKMTRIALDCVRVDPDTRPNMRRVANKISKLYLDSMKWSDTVRVPTEFSASFAPR